MGNLRQLKDRIKNISKKTDINAQILLRNYMLERLLERISLSELKDNFILKGGMLIAALVGIDMRSTIDMDATIKSYVFCKYFFPVFADLFCSNPPGNFMGNLSAENS